MSTKRRPEQFVLHPDLTRYAAAVRFSRIRCSICSRAFAGLARIASSAPGCAPAIRAFLDRHKLEPETTRGMGIGFEMTLVALRLAGRRDIANEAIASKVIALTEAGERDPERLCDGVLKD